ncbi:hypothetical protein LAV84_23575 [Rhizobium sp. VS19-DR104.2]|uniref:hypothetical protein n=1 Tax=unclassified Rhizobium TaxID=2613769 RepID=UPI001CC52DF7|nr:MULTISPECIES: hypothetical protein [unclassified Rhizobium]MBZ5762241.1 hypothetical protein [Rhizobium sp. VS19-DR96]MBZ5768257.1 hypothetical protein [Rhizobium sp. VS19-DR129.2]MBZ5775871.1 hypothetical protein [Rhizobium sp. VS19-DRK62.2]MBZ5787108.1 hypothetical protein [Rhizobium sp. VS19-DR121]MBZ5804182.1 hypothetical protein [Rhizobium sp. VS19-DR181]
MDKFEAHMKANPKAERDADTIREAFELVEQLRNAGFDSGGYDLAPSFGSRQTTGQRPSGTELRMSYSR